MISSTKINLPYYSQWESAKLVNKFIAKTLDETKDPKWKTSGAKSKTEYKMWANNACGMACLKMILKKEQNINTQTVALAKKCTAYGGYIIKSKDCIEGLFYKGFVEFVKADYKINAQLVKYLSVKRVLKEAEKGNYAIISVNKNIRDEYPKCHKKGGHLVLVSGYNLIKGIMLIHNPSGYYPNKQKYAEVKFNNLNTCFAHRGIIVYAKSSR